MKIKANDTDTLKYTQRTLSVVHKAVTSTLDQITKEHLNMINVNSQLFANFILNRLHIPEDARNELSSVFGNSVFGKSMIDDGLVISDIPIDMIGECTLLKWVLTHPTIRKLPDSVHMIIFRNVVVGLPCALYTGGDTI